MCDNCDNIFSEVYINANLHGDLYGSISIIGHLKSYKNDSKYYIKKCCLLKYYTGNSELERNFKEKILNNINFSDRERIKFIRINNTIKNVFTIYQFDIMNEELIINTDNNTKINRNLIISESKEQYTFINEIDYLNSFIRITERSLYKGKIEYIYLLKDRTAIKGNEEVYKIGKTKQANLKRFNSYPKGYNLILLLKCTDCSLIEKKIIQLFKKKYIQNKEYGNEYFIGNPDEMSVDINNIIYNMH